MSIVRAILYTCLICIIKINLISAQTVPIETSPFWQSSESNLYSTGMIWRDCNNDGYIDVFYSNGNDIVLAPNTIYLSDHGELPASASWVSANSEYSGHCAVGDINDDGWADFFVSNFLGQDGFSTANFSNLYLNSDGLPNQSPDWSNTDSIYSFSCATGDVDGDGDLDIAVATGEPYGSRKIVDRIYYNVNGSFESEPGWQSQAMTEAMDVTWGDVDNDGDLDLAFAYNDRPPAIFYNGGSFLETTPSWQADHNESSNTLIFGDVNGDGWLDLVVAFNDQLGGGGYFRVYYNDGTGQLDGNYGWQSSSGGYGSGLALYDYDYDGDLDLAAGRWFDKARIYENTGIGFTLTPVWRADASTVVEEMAWVDVDGHGLEPRADTISNVAGKKVYYTTHAPLYAIDSVMVDGALLGHPQFCYDLISGWVALEVEPTTELIICSQYSFTNDLAISHWDTYNMVWGNSNPSPILFSADTLIGFAPLEVNFSDQSIGASEWNWEFGDMQTSEIAHPTHTYQQAGSFDVSLRNLLPDGPHFRSTEKMIITLADSLFFPELELLVNQPIVVPISLTNAHPLQKLVLTVSFNGPPDLNYLGLDLTACRSDYFQQISILELDTAANNLAIEFIVGINIGKPPLSPGTGFIANLIFSAASSGGEVRLETVTTSSETTVLDAGYISYEPYSNIGLINIGECGDASGDGHVNVGDAVYLINFIFRDGLPPSVFVSGDANCDSFVNVGDAVYLINFVFSDGTPPCCND